MQIEPFDPAYGAGVNVSPGATSATTQIGKGNKQLVFSNTGSAVCYVRVGGTSVAATTADMIIMPGSQVTITKFEDHDYVSYISASGTTLNIIPGEGF